MSDSDREFIRAAWPGLSATKIAARIGFSKTAVIDYLKRENLWELRDDPANFEPATLGAEEDGQDTVGRMRELRDALKVSLVDADPRTMPALAREYRACVDEVAALEAEAGRDDGDDPFAGAARAFAALMPS